MLGLKIVLFPVFLALKLFNPIKLLWIVSGCVVLVGSAYAVYTGRFDMSIQFGTASVIWIGVHGFVNWITNISISADANKN